MRSWCHLAGRLPALDWVVAPVGAGGEEILGQGVVVLQQEAQPVGVHPPVPDVDVQAHLGRGQRVTTLRMPLFILTTGLQKVVKMGWDREAE